MLKIAASLLFLLLGCAAVRAQERRVEVTAGPRAISFSLPAGFERMSAEEVAAQFTRGVTPLAVFREPRRELRVTVNTFDGERQGVEDLPSLGKRLESDFAAAHPTAKRLSRDIVKLGGDEWVRLRYKATAGIGEVVSETYATLWAGEVIMVTFYGPAAEYEGQRAAFRKSAESIELSLSVNAPAGDAPQGRP
ncbi:MAG TPA: hypothetical protein VN228_05915 [Pyrinomonadaceae bacterium]|nr:hypothetical protein [Pyrinomonadaceae bacterium]